jgi:ABC-type lipoprotein export system ATPase subunit
MAILSGWTKPAEGRSKLTGIERTSWVFQNPHGTARRTALDHVSFPLIAAGQSARAADSKATGLLERFGLAGIADRQFRYLSGGEAQRLMLARAAASSPDLLLVDEPTAQLDRASARVVNDVLSQAVADDTILIVATHDEHTRDACDVQLDLTQYSPGNAQ